IPSTNSAAMATFQLNAVSTPLAKVAIELGMVAELPKESVEFINVIGTDAANPKDANTAPANKLSAKVAPRRLNRFRNSSRPAASLRRTLKIDQPSSVAASSWVFACK